MDQDQKNEIVTRYIADLQKAVQRAQMEYMNQLADEVFALGAASVPPTQVVVSPDDQTPFGQTDIDAAIASVTSTLQAQIDAMSAQVATATSDDAADKKKIADLSATLEAIKGLLGLQTPAPAPVQDPVSTPVDQPETTEQTEGEQS